MDLDMLQFHGEMVPSWVDQRPKNILRVINYRKYICALKKCVTFNTTQEETSIQKYKNILGQINSVFMIW